MKKLIIGLLFVGLTNLSFSQNMQNEIAEVELEGITVSRLNANYLDNVLDKSSPELVKRLVKEASVYNIKLADVYDRTFDSYEVIFSKDNGKIRAVYDSEGKIINSFEKYKNIKLPENVRNSVFKNHDGWVLHSDSYFVTYNVGKNAKKIYKVQLRKGKQKKNFTMDVNGNLV